MKMKSPLHSSSSESAKTVSIPTLENSNRISSNSQIMVGPCITYYLKSDFDLIRIASFGQFNILPLYLAVVLVSRHNFYLLQMRSLIKHFFCNLGYFKSWWQISPPKTFPPTKPVGARYYWYQKQLIEKWIPNLLINFNLYILQKGTPKRCGTAGERGWVQLSIENIWVKVLGEVLRVSRQWRISTR